MNQSGAASWQFDESSAVFFFSVKAVMGKLADERTKVQLFRVPISPGDERHHEAKILMSFYDLSCFTHENIFYEYLMSNLNAVNEFSKTGLSTSDLTPHQ